MIYVRQTVRTCRPAAWFSWNTLSNKYVFDYALTPADFVSW